VPGTLLSDEASISKSRPTMLTFVVSVVARLVQCDLGIAVGHNFAQICRLEHAARANPVLALSSLQHDGARAATTLWVTPLYRVKTASQRVAEVLTALAEGVDMAAAVRIFGHRHATITTWLRRTGEHSATLHDRVGEHLHLPHLQLDELRTRLRSCSCMWTGGAPTITLSGPMCRCACCWYSQLTAVPRRPTPINSGCRRGYIAHLRCVDTRRIA
jgi:hypothetical protein